MKRKCLESNDGRRYEPGKRKCVKSEFLGWPRENNDKISVNWIEGNITTSKSKVFGSELERGRKDECDFQN
jgi:hypothetical protein